jgi:hypothetical protein
MNRSFWLGILVTTVAAALTLVWALGTDEGRVRPALAGPCAADPELVFQSDPNNPLDLVRLYGTDGKAFVGSFRVETLPDVLPPGKPPVTADVIALPGHPGIEAFFSPDASDGSFNTALVVIIDSDVPSGAYDFVIEMECHEQITTIPFTVYVNTCPVLSFGFAPGGNGTPSPQPFPSNCAAPTPSPTPGSPTPTPSGSVTPTPGSPSPTPKPIWGDVNCKGDSATAADALAILRFVAGLSPNQTQPCPVIGGGGQFGPGGGAALPFGDVDCSNSVTSVDALKILRYVAELPVQQNEPCPDIGTEA